MPSRRARFIAGVALVVVTAACSSGAKEAAPQPQPTSSTRAPSSTGCGRAASSVSNATLSIDVSGASRSYILDVPANATHGTAVPIVFDLHGLAEGAILHHDETKFSVLGAREAFITVTPQGQDVGASVFFDARLGSDDVNFVRVLLDHLEATYCVDTKRVYATGYSNGAFMSSAIACDMADRFAAVAPVDGVRDIEGCKPARPVPVIVFHGTADRLINFNGGVSADAAKIATPALWKGPRDLPGINAVVPGSLDESIQAIVAAWAKRNGCDAAGTDSSVAADVTLTTYTCPVGADVEFYRVIDGGHTWPGSRVSAALASILGKTTFSIDATALIWKFFAAHPLG